MQGMTWERQNALHRVFDAAVRQRTCSETGGWRVCLPAGCGVPRRCGEKISDRPLGDAECSGDDGLWRPGCSKRCARQPIDRRGAPAAKLARKHDLRDSLGHAAFAIRLRLWNGTARLSD